MFTYRLFLLLPLILLCNFIASSQTPLPPPPQDSSLRIIQIIQGQRLREKTIDTSTNIQTIAGDVILKEGLTIFYCDSASIDRKTNILEAFGHIHINQNDSIHTYSQTLRYIGNDRIAFLKKDVRLTDNKGTLYTQDLEYDLKSSVGKYKTGGRVVNGKTVLTSTEGTYFAETKDVYFKKNVHLVDPKYDMRNDTLLYNTQTQVSSWTTATVIKSKNGGDIYSSNGTYDLKNGKAFFGNRTVIKDSSRTYVSDNSAYDEISGIAQLEGNAVIRDSVNNYTVLGGQIFLNKNDNSFLATRKPVLIFKGEGNDSTVIAADTLFSGVDKLDKNGKRIIVKRDTLKKQMVISAKDSLLAINKIKDSADQQKARPTATDTSAVTAKAATGKDSLRLARLVLDSFAIAASTLKKNIDVKDNMRRPLTISNIMKAHTDSLRALVYARDTSKKAIRKNLAVVPKNIPMTLQDSVRVQERQDSIMYTNMVKRMTSKRDTIKTPLVQKKITDTVIRYFIAFHNVRIFNDSLQSVCDSLYYTSEDSVFRLYKDPLVFSNNSQIAGDTIHLYTKNKKPERLYVFENSIMINKANESMFNQMGGRTLNGYFKDGQIDYVRVKGSPAESVYYPQDDDSAYIGMNRSKGDVIDVYFVDKAVNKVKFINDVDGTLYPLRQIPPDQKHLKNYNWQDKRRPKSKFELFE